jgi:hypothetical protein
MFLLGNHTVEPVVGEQPSRGHAMNRRYALYALAGILLVFTFASTSYGILLFASVVGILLLSASIMAWVGLFSVSERIAHGAVRAFKTVAPGRVTSMIFRQ